MHTKHDLYVVARAMISGLGDKYSEFLDPAAFRAAIRRPTQAELDYLSSQAVGTLLGLFPVNLNAVVSSMGTLKCLQR